MSVKERIKKSIVEVLKKYIDDKTLLYEILSDSSKIIGKPKREMGDFSSTLPMQLAKSLKKNPHEIANEIASMLKEYLIDVVDEIKVVGGFVNFFVKNNTVVLSEVLREVLEKKDQFGNLDIGGGKKIMIEFGQPNTHKAFHVGHLKSAISGLSLSRIYKKAGFEVIQANYFGDVGMQTAKATWGFIKKGEPEGFAQMSVHDRMKYIDECYVYGSNKFNEDQTAENEIREINKEIYDQKDAESTKVYKLLREYSIEHQIEVFKTLGVEYDVQYPESTVFLDAMKIVNEHKGDIFTQSEGAWIFEGEKYGLRTWVFETSEGNPTYSAKDLGLAFRKFKEYPDLHLGIVTTSVEQNDYFKGVIKVLEIIAPQFTGKYKHIPFGWMLREDGQKFSSRMGDTVKGVDILEEVERVALKKVTELAGYSEDEKALISKSVAQAGLKFLILSHEFYKDFSYNPDKFLSFQGYSGPYILYSYVRAKSILEKSNGYNSQQGFSYSGEITSTEKELLSLMEDFSEYVQRAVMENSPHLVANYVYDLSKLFNTFYTESPVLDAPAGLKEWRLNLLTAVALVIKDALSLLGIDTIERM